MIILNNIKFGKKGIKDQTGKYYPCWYSIMKLISGQVALTIYAKRCGSLPKELSPSNGSDMMTDYFESDKVRFMEGTPEFEALKSLAN